MLLVGAGCATVVAHPWPGWALLVLGLLGVAVESYRHVLDASSHYDRERFLRIYDPLVLALAGCFIASGQAVLAPYLSQRLRHAAKLARRWQLRAALVAIFDKRETPEHAGVEYGKPFPLARIAEIVRRNQSIADERLLELLWSAEHSQREDFQRGDDDLTAEELRLHRYIIREESRLRRRARTMRLKHEPGLA